MVTCPDLYGKRQSKLESKQKMTFDQAATEQKKMRICRREDIVFDPNVLTICTGIAEPTTAIVKQNI